jgi:hypothetical protein
MGQCCSSEETKTAESVPPPEPAPTTEAPADPDPKSSPPPEAPEPKPEPKTFSVSYQKAEYPKVGLDIQQMNKKTLLVKKLKEGPVTNYNKDASDKVDENDHIVSVNGVSDDSQAMLSEISNATGLMNLTFCKGLAGTPGVYYIKNQWCTTDNKANTMNSHPGKSVDMSWGEQSACWIFSPLGGGTYHIRNQWSGGGPEWSWYLNLEENNNVSLYENPPAEWQSAKWRVVDAGSGWFRYQSVWKPDLYLNVKDGYQSIEVVQNPNSDWQSAQWKRVQT